MQLWITQDANNWPPNSTSVIWGHRQTCYWKAIMSSGYNVAVNQTWMISLDLCVVSCFFFFHIGVLLTSSLILTHFLSFPSAATCWWWASETWALSHVIHTAAAFRWFCFLESLISLISKQSSARLQVNSVSVSNFKGALCNILKTR